jgi:hypothetical protein
MNNKKGSVVPVKASMDRAAETKYEFYFHSSLRIFFLG